MKTENDITVKICHNCKAFWIAPAERCTCGSETLGITSRFNAKFAENYDSRINGAYERGDKVIWDSGHGYELGLYCGKGVMYYTYELDIHSGICAGIVSHRIDQIYPYSEKLHSELSEKYGYEKKFKN